MQFTSGIVYPQISHAENTAVANRSPNIQSPRSGGSIQAMSDARLLSKFANAPEVSRWARWSAILPIDDEPIGGPHLECVVPRHTTGASLFGSRHPYRASEHPPTVKIALQFPHPHYLLPCKAESGHCRSCLAFPRSQILIILLLCPYFRRDAARFDRAIRTLNVVPLHMSIKTSAC